MAQSLASRILESPAYRIRYSDDTLANGLRVLVVERHFVPVVSAELFVPGGMNDDAPVRLGLAHLVEHLTGDTLSDYPRRAGVASNASTGSRTTDYFFTAPTRSLDPALYFLSAVLRPPLLDSGRVARDKAVVIAEGGQRASNRAYGLSSPCTSQLYWFTASPCTGPADWDRETLATSGQEIVEYFEDHYRPNGAILVVVGDVSRSDVLAKVRKFFLDIPRRPERPSSNSQDSGVAVKRFVLTDALAPSPRIDIAYATMRPGTPEFAAVNVLAAVLGRGQAPVLSRRLAEERRLVTSVEVWGLDSRGSRSPPLVVSAVLAPGVEPAVAERAMKEEIARLATRPVSRADLERAKGLLAHEFLADTRGDGSRGLAYNLGFYAMADKDPELINSWLRAVDEVSEDDLRSVVARLVASPPRVVVTTLPVTTDSTSHRAAP